ncbi:P450 monooxygenase 1 [Cordyceps fumosorosea ARSEF 2679]|uniref:p450 monooxygenase 1 n=1 Tax=Cordyceps fumosorosea (strain ARSEF 2679) TaxID=1081104 RepID=A0A167CP76_CORFA|nr:P450 monooxygenase 1 [Cordyceps fumosorosea ARSEF 2679]OAA41414.1 P450 monooxygenase 1 [Cordyceps fumosorosea ARSEF 2679]
MSFPIIFGAVAGVVAVYLCAATFYNVLLHPLRDIPGPILFRASVLPKSYYMIGGILQFKVKSLHDEYGAIVRIAPNEISVVGAGAWNDVYGRRSGGGGELSKYYDFYVLDKSSPRDIITAEPAQHRVLRRLLAHGFSERSMHAQGSIIGGYIDILISSLRSSCDNGDAVVDLNQWLNWTTFDIIGNLSFGSDASNLRGAEWTPWVKASAKHNKAMAIVACLKGLGFGKLIKLAIRCGLLPTQGYLDYIKSHVKERAQLGVERPDFIEGLIQEQNGLSLDEIARNGEALIGAGSESTATFLSGAIYALLTHPEWLEKVTTEVRTAFKSEEEIDFTSVKHLDCMLACLHETFRYYPPVTNGMPRVAPKGGTLICGTFVPENLLTCARFRLWWQSGSGQYAMTPPSGQIRTNFGQKDFLAMESSKPIS